MLAKPNVTRVDAVRTQFWIRAAANVGQPGLPETPQSMAKKWPPDPVPDRGRRGLAQCTITES